MMPKLSEIRAIVKQNVPDATVTQCVDGSFEVRSVAHCRKSDVARDRFFGTHFPDAVIRLTETVGTRHNWRHVYSVYLSE